MSRRIHLPDGHSIQRVAEVPISNQKPLPLIEEKHDAVIPSSADAEPRSQLRPAGKRRTPNPPSLVRSSTFLRARAADGDFLRPCRFERVPWPFSHVPSRDTRGPSTTWPGRPGAGPPYPALNCQVDGSAPMVRKVSFHLMASQRTAGTIPPRNVRGNAPHGLVPTNSTAAEALAPLKTPIWRANRGSVAEAESPQVSEPERPGPRWPSAG
jgi:hypothetical protein